MRLRSARGAVSPARTDVVVGASSFSFSTTAGDAALRFPGVGLPTVPGRSFDLFVKDGRIERFDAQASAAPNYLMFPPFADLHVHANRAYTLAAGVPASLEHAIEMAHELATRFTAADYARHSTQLFAAAARKGTMRIRTHADVSIDCGLEALQGTLAAAAAFADRLDIEVVAFASNSYDPVDAHAQRVLREACALGAGFLGAVPAYYADSCASIDALLDLAVALGVPVDLHLDEHLDAARSCSEYLAAATRARGLEGRVTLSHGCAIAVLPHEARLRVAAALARAGITVIVLPTTNLYLQDRRSGAPAHRGLTAVKDLAAAGVNLRFASDNVRDAFFPYGSPDLLEIAHLTVMAAQVDSPELLVRGICGGAAELAAGSEANFVLVPGGSLTEVLAERPRRRVVVRRGIVCEDASPPV